MKRIVKNIRELMRKVEKKGGKWSDVMDGLRKKKKRIW